MPLKFRPATPILSTGAVQPLSTAAVREFTAFRTLLNRLDINVTGCRDAGMPQYALSVFQRSMFLHIRTQRPSHHLKGDEVVSDSQLTGDRTHAPGRFPQRGAACPFRFPRPNVGNVMAQVRSQRKAVASSR